MKTLLQSLAALGLLLGASACNTVEGVGKDTEYVGDRIQDASEAVEEGLDD
ncbi:MAG: entericidin [Pseudomonadota bacterium]